MISRETQCYRIDLAILTLFLGLVSAMPAFSKSVSIEAGSGHGGTLTLYHIDFNGSRTALLIKSEINTGGFAKLPRNTDWPGDSFNTSYQEYELEGNEVKSLWSEIEAALIFPKKKKSEAGDGKNITGYGSWVSSNDFLASVRLMDNDIQMEKTFCGYANGGDSLFYESILSLISKIEAVLRIEKPTGIISGEKSSHAFHDALAFAFSKKDQHGWWWVIERSILLFGVKENNESLPLILNYLRMNRATLNNRTLCNLMTALDNITGKSLRFNDGKPKSLERVVSEYSELYGLKD